VIAHARHRVYDFLLVGPPHVAQRPLTRVARWVRQYVTRQSGEHTCAVCWSATARDIVNSEPHTAQGWVTVWTAVRQLSEQ
jgi:hypothetical protein